MDNEVKLTLVIPSKVYLEEKVASVIIPAVRADVNILPDRAPSVFVLDFGVVQVLDKNGSVKKRYFIQSGMADISGNACRIMTQGIVPYDDMTPHLAKQKVEAAENEQDRLFYQMILDYQRGIRRRYLRTLKLFSAKFGEKTHAEIVSDIRAGIEALRKRKF